MPQSRVRHLIGLLLGMAFLTAPAAAADSVSEPKPVRVTLRADWANPTKSIWEGAVRLGQGRIASVRPMQMRAGQIRVLPMDDTDEVQFQTQGPVLWCGLEVVVEAPPQALVELVMDGHRLETRLEELFLGSVASMAWEGSARLRRDPADILPVTLNRPHLIFAPGEQANVYLDFNLLTAEPRTVATKLCLTLRPARGGADLSPPVHGEVQVPTNSSPPLRRRLEIRMPDLDGAYDLVVRAEPAGLRPVERVVQFAVLDPNANKSSIASELVTKLVQEIDPAQPVGGGPWYSTRRLLARTSRLGQFLWSNVRHPFGSQNRLKDSPVYLCRLNVEHPGQPHFVSIDYEASSNLLLSMSVTEQDHDGRWVQLPIASGVKWPENPSPPGVQGHQLVFWPQTKSPSLSLYVEGAAGVAAVKKVRLFELPQGLPGLKVLEADGRRRLFGLHIDSPDVWACWGSARAIDIATGLPLDDWCTFLDSMDHVAQYARFAGYNCLHTTVVGQGGAMYPTKLLDSNFRLDSGYLADSAPDPMRKDVVDLLLRTCQRHRLSLVPNVRFDGTIPLLEQKLGGADQQAGGMLLVSREGKLWENQANQGGQLARRYNPLNLEVQAALIEVVREFVQRYGAQPALEGLALDLATGSHVVLPGMEWGYDDNTVERFQRESGFDLSAVPADDAARFAQRYQLLSTTGREQWNAWRCRQMAGFFETVLAELQKVNPNGRVMLSLTSLLQSGPEEARDAARSGRSIEDSLQARGIDLRNWPVPRDIVVLRPFAASGSTAEGLLLNASRELDDLMTKLPSRGGLCIHEPEVLYLSAAASEAQRSGELFSEVITVPLTRPGRSNLRRFAQSLAGGDCQVIFEGGPAIPLGHEQVQREFARVFRSLPANQFQSVETLQPVVVRSYHDTRDTLVYLVNDASYSVETSLSFRCSTHVTLVNGSTGDRLSVQPTEHGLGTKVTLEPFQTVSVRLSASDPSVAQCNVIVPPAADKGLKMRFDRLHQAMAVLGRDAARTLEGLPPNGDIEEIEELGLRPAHWSAEGVTSNCVADFETVHGGKCSLRLTGNTGDGVLSDWFTPPDGRALALNVWLRSDRPGLRARWFLMGNQDQETVYRSYADVPLTGSWEQKQFRARDLPNGLLNNVQIRFQLLDAGTLWIDEAQVCALPISTDEKAAISKSVSAIFQAWKERRRSDFERLADGYWPTYLIESVEVAKEP